MSRSWLPLFVLLAFLGGSDRRAQGEDEASVREFARAELIREARRIVLSSSPGGAALLSMRKNLREDMTFAAAFEPAGPDEAERLAAFEATIRERTLLLGLPVGKEERAETPVGALAEAGLLSNWLVGASPSQIVVGGGTAGDAEPRRYVYPPAREAGAEAPSPGGAAAAETAPAAAAGPGETPAGDPPAKERGGVGTAASAAGEGTAPPAAPGPAAPAKEAGAAPASATGVLDIPRWARDVVRAAEGGSLLERSFQVVDVPRLDSLVAAAASAPVFVHPEVGTLRRHALLGDQVVAYNATLAALRLLQADEHSKAMQADQPQPSMVDAGIVREKEQMVARFQELISRHTARRERIFVELDAMVDDLDGWKTQAALLAGEIEDLRKSAGEPQGGPLPPSQELRLRLAQARETCVTLDILLLYHAASRADARLQILNTLLRAATGEAAAAESVLASYKEALLRLRNSRRLDRIGSDNRKLRRWIATGERREPVVGSIGAARIVAYRRLLELNEIVQEAVRTRELMSAAPTVAAPTEPEAQDADVATGQPNPSTLVLRPQKAAWDEKYIQLSRTELNDPAFRETFDADLVARHFAVVNQRIAGLLKAQEVASEEAALQARFLKSVAIAEAALAPVSSDSLSTRARKLPALLSTAREDFEAAMQGISEQREMNQARLRALLAYRTELRSQGTRSLLIRVERKLDDAYVGAALRETQDAIDHAGRWLSFQGEEHAGRFLAASWLRLVLVLAALVLALFLARLGRGVVDRWIQNRVAAHPSLAAEGASLREERERGKEVRLALDAVAAQTSADVVLQQIRTPETATPATGAAQGEAPLSEAPLADPAKPVPDPGPDLGGVSSQQGQAR